MMMMMMMMVMMMVVVVVVMMMMMMVMMMMAAFSSSARILGECSTIHSPPAFLFFKVESRSRTLIPLFRSGSVHSGSAS